MAAALASGRAAAATAAAASSTPRPRVAVIGAGYAGLAAALALQRSGACDVTVLEAGQRPGGRACTQRMEGSSPAAWFESGATWFHGLGTPEEPNPVFQHALELGLIGSSPEAERWWSSQFMLPGSDQPLTKEQQIAVTHTLAAWTEAVESLSPDAQGTVAEHLEAAWQALLASGRLAPGQLEVARRAWRWRELLQRAMDGAHSTAVQSAQGLALYDEMPGGVHCALPAGMQTVADRLAGQVADLRLGHEVRAIRWESGIHGTSASAGGGGSGGGSSGSGGAPVLITCANGATLEADAAVVTVSLGVLKAAHRQLFSPPLPAAKAAAIERLGIGVVDKLLLDFGPPAGGEAAAAAAAPAAAGPASSGSVPGGEPASPPVSFALLWSEAWEGAGGPGSAGAGGQQPAVAAASKAEAQLPGWARGIFSLRFGGPEVKRAAGAAAGSEAAEAAAAAAKAAEGGEGAAEDSEEEFSPCAEARQPSCYQAVAWVTGREAVEMEAASDDEVLRALRQLARLFPQLQLPPGASWDRVRLHRSRWGSDPLFRGSYTYIPAGASPADVAALAAPLRASASSSSSGGEGSSGGAAGAAGPLRLLFAGEACQTTYIGTMHGAYLSGRAAAEALLEQWQDMGC